MRRIFLISGALLVVGWFPIGSAEAAQPLIPSPYPENFGPNAMEGTTPHPHYHQHLLRDAAPALNGPNALGNPHFGRLHRHQHLVPEPYPRQWWNRY